MLTWRRFLVILGVVGSVVAFAAALSTVLTWLGIGPVEREAPLDEIAPGPARAAAEPTETRGAKPSDPKLPVSPGVTIGSSPVEQQRPQRMPEVLPAAEPTGKPQGTGMPEWAANEVWAQNPAVIAACSNSDGAEGKVRWLDKPQPVNLADFYPPAAMSARVEDEVVLKCLVGVDGRVSNCRVIYDQQPAYEFAVMALKISREFKLSPDPAWDYRNGDAPLCVPVQFRLPGI